MNLEKKSFITAVLPALILCFISSLFYHHQYFWRVYTETYKPMLTVAYALDEEKYALLVATMYYPYVIVQFISGFFINRFHPIKTLSLCAIGHLIGCFCFLFSSTFFAAQVSYFVIGASGGVSLILALYIARIVLSKKHYTSACGFIASFGAFGALISGVPIKWLSKYFFWRHILMTYALLDVVIVLGCLYLFARCAEQMNLNELAARYATKGRLSWNRIMTWNLWGPAIYLFFQYMSMMSFVAVWLVPFTIADLHSHMLYVYSSYTTVLISYIMSSNLIGLLEKRISKKTGLSLASACGIVASSYLLYFSQGHVVLLFMSLILLGMALSAFSLTVSVVAGGVEKEMTTIATSICTAMANVGGVFILTLAAFLIQHQVAVLSLLHAYQRVFIFVPCSFLIALCISFCLNDV
jgi:MFS family permease